MACHTSQPYLSSLVFYECCCRTLASRKDAWKGWGLWCKVIDYRLPAVLKLPNHRTLAREILVPQWKQNDKVGRGKVESPTLADISLTRSPSSSNICATLLLNMRGLNTNMHWEQNNVPTDIRCWDLGLGVIVRTGVLNDLVPYLAQ